MLTKEQIEKRIAETHKANVAKAISCMAKAAVSRDKGMGFLEKAAGHFVEAKKANKAMDLSEVGGHLVKAAEHFGEMEDQQELAAHHIGKVAGAWGMGSGLPTATGGSIEEKTQAELTEGEVPEDEAGKPYPGKVAGMVTEGEAAAREKAARLEGQLAGKDTLIEALSKQPAGSPRARLFALDKTAFGGDASGNDPAKDPIAKLMNGVHFDQNDPDSRDAAAGKMIANMIGDSLTGGKTFGKQVISDPNFRGAAANVK